MSELIPCPFCGWEFAEHAWNEFGEEYRVCDQCGASSGTVDSKWDWQSRPIEDELRKRIAELESTLSANNELLIPALKKRESEIVELSNKTISKLNKRIAELEAMVDKLIEAGKQSMNFTEGFCNNADRDKPEYWHNWNAIVAEYKERDE